MTDFLRVFAPALGNFTGGLLAEWREPSARKLNWALHAAAGVLFAAGLGG